MKRLSIHLEREFDSAIKIWLLCYFWGTSSNSWGVLTITIHVAPLTVCDIWHILFLNSSEILSSSIQYCAFWGTIMVLSFRKLPSLEIQPAPLSRSPSPKQIKWNIRIRVIRKPFQPLLKASKWLLKCTIWNILAIFPY